MFRNCAVHAEFLRDHADYGFDVTLNGFNWKYELVIVGSRKVDNEKTRKVDTKNVI